MAAYKIVRSNEVESTYEVKGKNSKIDKKYHDDNLQISQIHMSPDRILYVEPLPTEDAYKSYFILKGSCFVFDDGSIIKEGDLMVFRNTEDVQTLKTLEDTMKDIMALDIHTDLKVKKFR